MSSFNTDDLVEAVCYQPGCEDVVFSVLLDKELYVEPGCVLSPGVGRLKWPANLGHSVFRAVEQKEGKSYFKCPHCSTAFDCVVIVEPPGSKPIIFCYDPEPA